MPGRDNTSRCRRPNLIPRDGRHVGQGSASAGGPTAATAGTSTSLSQAEFVDRLLVDASLRS